MFCPSPIVGKLFFLLGMFKKDFVSFLFYIYRLYFFEVLENILSIKIFCKEKIKYQTTTKNGSRDDNSSQQRGDNNTFNPSRGWTRRKPPPPHQTFNITITRIDDESIKYHLRATTHERHPLFIITFSNLSDK